MVSHNPDPAIYNYVHYNVIPSPQPRAVAPPRARYTTRAASLATTRRPDTITTATV